MTAILPYQKPKERIVCRDRKGRFAASPKPPTVSLLVGLAEEIALSLIGLQPNKKFRPPKVNIPINVEQVTRCLKSVETYNKLLAGQWSAKSITRFGLGVLAQIRGITETLNHAEGEMLEARKARDAVETKLISWEVHPRDIFNELSLICRTFECYWGDNNCLEVLTPSITIVHPGIRVVRYNFGRMIIPIGCDFSAVVKPHSPRRSNGAPSGYYHPHIRGSVNGILCLGNATDAVNRAWKQGRILDVIDLMVAILSTYGSNPYKTIEQWNGVCDEKFDPTTGLAVPYSYRVIEPSRPVVTCASCGVQHDNPVSCWDESCSLQNVCIGCLIRCQGTLPDETRCNNYMCDAHTWTCESCGLRMCRDHFTLDSSDELCDRCYCPDEDE